MAAASAWRAGELLWMYSARARAGHFGLLLGLKPPRDGGDVRLRRCATHETEVSVRWPAWLCRDDGALCLGGALAMADEITTFAGLCLFDRRARPGLTIGLSGTLAGGPLPAVNAGDEITFVTRPIKIGASLGFVGFDVLHGDRLIASGRHTKYLSPPGLGFRLAALANAPLCRPLAHAPAERALASRAALAPPAPECRADVLALERRDAPPAAETGAHVAEFGVALSPAVGNPAGTLHGGAVAMLGDLACAAAHEEAAAAGGAASRAPPARMIDAAFFSSIAVGARGPGVALVRASAAPPHVGANVGAEVAPRPPSIAVIRDGRTRSTAMEVRTWG